MHNTHHSNISIYEDEEIITKEKEIPNSNELLSSKIKENSTKEKLKGRTASQPIQSTLTKENIKTRNKKDIFKKKDENSNSFLETKKNSLAVTATKYLKNKKLENNSMKINSETKFSFNDDYFGSNVIENRNDTLYLFSKIKAENKKNKEIIHNQKKIKEELKTCTFKPKVTPIKKINDLFRAPTNNFVKLQKISNPKNTKLSYIDRLHTWNKVVKDK